MLLLLGLALAGMVSIIYSFGILFLWIGILTWGSFSINSGVYIPSINTLKTKHSKIAITFDDGPHENTEAILGILKKYDAKATFFLTGENAEKMPEVVRKMKEEGHQIGNHTYSHSGKFPIFSLNKMFEEIAKTSIILKKLTGVQPTLFRPPFGVTNPRIAKILTKINLKVVGWSVRSLDTVTKNRDKIVRRIIAKTKPGSIILMHEYTQHSEFVLEQILKHFSKNGFRFVRVEEMKNE